MHDESEIGKKNAGNSRDFVFNFNTLTLIRSLQNVNQFNFDPLSVEIYKKNWVFSLKKLFLGPSKKASWVDFSPRRGFPRPIKLLFE